MSPIFVRPVREQLEHDRLIRFLQARYKRKLEVAANVGDEQLAPLKVGAATFFPDLLLTSGKKLAGVVEVESAESVNNLEAMAEWVHYARARVPFHLYVPVQMYDAARRLSEANKVNVAELWTYRATNDGFDLVRMIHDASSAPAQARPAAPKPSAPKPAVPETRGAEARSRETRASEARAREARAREARAEEASRESQGGEARQEGRCEDRRQAGGEEAGQARARQAINRERGVVALHQSDA